jgi:hypothetical protein
MPPGCGISPFDQSWFLPDLRKVTLKLALNRIGSGWYLKAYSRISRIVSRLEATHGYWRVALYG